MTTHALLLRHVGRSFDLMSRCIFALVVFMSAADIQRASNCSELMQLTRKSNCTRSFTVQLWL